MTTFRLSILSATVVASSFAIPASAQVACTMDAKQCPDGSYVGRVAPDCAFAACPGMPSCAPYVCKDGTTHPSCTEDGHVINYFAEPCLTHGGEAGPFSDVAANHPNAQAIAYLKANGIVQGYADGTFKPDATINRAEFVKIITESKKEVYLLQNGQQPDWLSHCFDSASTKPYSDITPSMWFGKYVCAASEVGTIAGYPDGTFRPANLINFAEAAKIVSNAYGVGTLAVDAPLQDPWYKPYVTALADSHAIPTSITSFDQRITRGEMAEMIYRLKANVTNEPSQTYENLSSSADVKTKDGSCAAVFLATHECPQDRCIMDCADRDNQPANGLSCPPGCFEK